jgi:putative transposase
MELRAENYRWSSAAAHCGNRSDSLLNLESAWNKQFAAIDDWSAWLSEGDETLEIQILRQNVEKGLPCGDASFIQRLGKIVGRPLESRPQGRPRKAQDEK